MRTWTPRRSTARSLIDSVTEFALARYDAREEELGEELMGALERFLLLQIIDERWREHLYDMDYLREGIHLRGFAQIDPLVAYKNEAFTLFGDLMNTHLGRLRADDLQRPGQCRGGAQNGGHGAERGRLRRSRPRATPRARAASPTRAGAARWAPVRSRPPQPPPGGHRAGGRYPRTAAKRAGIAPVVEQRVVDEEHQVGRNDPCWCGRGKKFKKCHGA